MCIRARNAGVCCTCLRRCEPYWWEESTKQERAVLTRMLVSLSALNVCPRIYVPCAGGCIRNKDCVAMWLPTHHVEGVCLVARIYRCVRTSFHFMVRTEITRLTNEVSTYVGRKFEQKARKLVGGRVWIVNHMVTLMQIHAKKIRVTSSFGKREDHPAKTRYYNEREGARTSVCLVSRSACIQVINLQRRA